MDKIQKRIKANRIFGTICFRDHFCSHPGRHSWDLCEHPLYYWKMKAAMESKYLEKILLFTEVEEAWQLAKKMSDKFVVKKRTLKECREPEWIVVDDLKTSRSRKSVYSGDFNRIAGDVSKTIIKLLGFEPTIRVNLSACCPLETADDIDKLIERYFEDDLAEQAWIVYKTLSCLVMKNPKNPKYLLRLFNIAIRQFGPQLYLLTGTFIRSYEWTGREKGVYIEIPPERGIDIHNKKNLELAEFYMRKRLDKLKSGYTMLKI